MNVDTGTFEAITGRLAAVERAVAELSARAGRADQIEDIMRRAEFGEAPAPRPARPRHLRAVSSGAS
jgi:hypothetical protein